MKLFVNALTHLDASWWSASFGLTGASWLVDLELDAPQGEDGMILDFGRVKPWAKRFLDEGADHTLLLPAESPHLEFHELAGERLKVVAHQPYPMTVEGPGSAFTLLPMAEITAAALAAYLTSGLNQQLPLLSGQVSLQLREEALGDAPEIHYSHGLRLHAGNCQRIAHGHRSKLEVFCDGQPAPEAAKRLAQHWNHAYLYDQADLIAADEKATVIGYSAPQGAFQVSLPTAVVRQLPGPTTVENLAEFLFQQLQQEAPESSWQVRMYEGINKGALAD